MLNKVYIFDCDGTLTPSRQQMTPKFHEFFAGWLKENPFWLVTGSDLPKMKEQIPENILEKAQGVFTCGGNQLWREGPVKQWPTDWKMEYEKVFQPHKALIDYLLQELQNSSYKGRFGTHIENRGSMINFSIVGRDCSYEDRLDYYEWDKKNNERERICFTINKMWPLLEAVRGGQISIDIAPRGRNKSQVLEEIKERRQFQEEYIFIGDRTEEGGNDYPLAKVMNETDNCRVFQTEGPEQTMEILQTIEAEK
tara:strand:- start:523 stop:1281 length:759 start_codon:yes stop_codon:yes gene_type:complete